jgi:hypothetical protein
MTSEFEQIVRESIREEIALIKEGLKTYYLWSEDRGRTYGVYPKSYGNPKPILKGKEKDLMKVLLKISKHDKRYLEDAFSETADPDTMDELNLDTAKMAKLGIKEAKLEKEKFTDPDQMRMYEAKTYKDYGISDKADMALAKLPDKLFNKKGITALAKKLKQDPNKMIAYAKDAFDWLYKESVNEASSNFNVLFRTSKAERVGRKIRLGSKKDPGHEVWEKVDKMNWMNLKTGKKLDINKWAKHADKFHMSGQDLQFEAYRPGDMWSKNFDYKGMMKFAMKVNSNTPVEIIQKLVDSMEDVNYHTEAEYLFDVLPKMKQIQKNSKLSPATKGKLAAQVDDVLRKFNKVAKATYASMR